MRIITLLALTAVTSLSSYAADAKAGEAVYGKACKSCHGTDGTPNPAIAKMMKVDMKPLQGADVQGKSDADLKKVITMGEGKMKPISSVSGGDADNVVAYLRTLKK